MKKNNPIRNKSIILILLISIIISSSCSTTNKRPSQRKKKKCISCPTFSYNPPSPKTYCLNFDSTLTVWTLIQLIKWLTWKLSEPWLNRFNEYMRVYPENQSKSINQTNHSSRHSDESQFKTKKIDIPW